MSLCLGRLRRWLLSVRPSAWLLLAILVYFTVSVLASWLRSIELQTTTWDMGIYQQALWSTSHGRPFYEAPDVETGGIGSFLQVHSAFVLYLIVPLYAVAPYQLTLFVIQSAVVASASYPLYLLARSLTGSAYGGLAAGVMFLAWAPTLASNLYDFHIESFLPLEVFAFVFLWYRERYRTAWSVAALAFLTMELTPVLLFAVAIFFLLPESDTLQTLKREWKLATSIARFSREAGKRALTGLLTPRGRNSLALAVTCVVAYEALVLVREDFLSVILGVPAYPSFYSGYVIGTAPSTLGIGLGWITYGLQDKVLSWLLLFALLGLVPLLAPRTLVLSIPWLVFSVASYDLNYVEIGFQYGFVEACSLLISFAYGLAAAQRIWARWRASVGTEPGPVRSWDIVAWIARRSPQRAKQMVILGFVILIAVNVASTPLNTTLNTGALGSAYRFSFTPAPGYQAVEDLAQSIPAGSCVLATDNLFPLLANDLCAYSMFWRQDPQLVLPFNGTHLPAFVLWSSERAYAVPSWLLGPLSNTSDYQVRGSVESSPAGMVILYQLGSAAT